MRVVADNILFSSDNQLGYWGRMATQAADVPELLKWVQQASTRNIGDDPSAKRELLHRLDVVRREIEGPASYLSRVRQAVSSK